MKKRKKPYKPETLSEIHFWLPKEVMNRIREMSSSLNLTISQFCRKALIDYLSKIRESDIDKKSDAV